VKTNLVFFTKGRETTKIWYYDLSHIKTGKKTPFTLRHFEEFFQLLPKRADSKQSWTVDFSARLQKALDVLLRGRTSFIVAHRLSTIRKANLVLVLDQGRIVERGTHDSLLRAQGIYARLHHEFVSAQPPG